MITGKYGLWVKLNEGVPTREIYLTPPMRCNPPESWKTIVRVESKSSTNAIGGAYMTVAPLSYDRTQ